MNAVDDEIRESWREGLALVREKLSASRFSVDYESAIRDVANDNWDRVTQPGLDEIRRHPQTNVPSDNLYGGIKYDPGYIYLLHSQNHLFKIGKSKNLDDRVENIGLLVPYDIRHVRSIFTDSMSWHEKWLHSVYAPRRVKGEWFQLSFWDFAFFYIHQELIRLTPWRDVETSHALQAIACDYEFDTMPIHWKERD